MSNVIELHVPPRRQRLTERAGGLIELFATHRRHPDDVFWLKENAELLGILECTGTEVGVEALLPHQDFYKTLSERLQFFPQYYRFLLSIGLDLEDLGLPGTQMEGLCQWAAHQRLPEAELSDLQRAEARRLLARRGVDCTAADPGLDDRLRGFIARPETFALPNKKAAYELTHIVFYLSEYGRRDPCLDAATLQSLEYVGILAYLDQNIDLLAEVCVALRQAGKAPNAIWVEAVRRSISGFRVIEDPSGTASDDYHEYLVASWAVQVLGLDGTGCPLPQGRAVFQQRIEQPSALRAVSAALLATSETRSCDWGQMCDYIFDLLDDDAGLVLETTIASTAQFEPFFELFARA
ncbi:hypothetical protein [uncultured Tateyamaria sp.]|uniref:DUF6902 family protein n=1 Tax=uncultured Tateyamaria sp. TaxID=455651 RepID=UPI00262842AE|nr:hypothetical protein [uncultured Tateyamaria sp.]